MWLNIGCSALLALMDDVVEDKHHALHQSLARVLSADEVNELLDQLLEVLSTFQVDLHVLFESGVHVNQEFYGFIVDIWDFALKYDSLNQLHL